MKYYTFIFIFLISQNLYARTKWSKAVANVLPPAIEQIKIKKSTKKDVEKLLGKASLVEKDKHYYEISGFKYSLEIIYNKNLVQEFSYTFLAPKPLFDSKKLEIDIKEMTPAPTSGGASGRYFKYSDEDGDLIIDPISKSLYSVRFK